MNGGRENVKFGRKSTLQIDETNQIKTEKESS